ncbi:class I SAM-dependent methyltransferase [Methanobacterium alcaliphilum]|uniref:class I SAM-dependent methyltransferase n=1 Tax=Methanobacterium alcaliphilum TaxID=392018 RepID=UPI00200AD69B|nr:class I SAM-dependent methyltransferase [Methanobacterium alcaliphilum]MCK9152186.1 class I SAM-dependent methyltransferase [Methanobacterium alcaliphilum]
MIKPIFKDMDLKCKCGSTCIRTAKKILENTNETFAPCTQCINPQLKKFSPLTQQIKLTTIDRDFGLCDCGKRHIDSVIAHILKIMIDEGIKPPNSNLRKTCIPLINPAYDLQAAPYLREKSLIVLSPEFNKLCAERIIEDVVEVKGVLMGDAHSTVGIKDSNYKPYVYDLLAGCDLRCDIVNSPCGPICIHKDQGEIHIEFPRKKNLKVAAVSNFIKKNYLENEFSVLDATCGPGTLGIFSLKAGAQKVIFNDLWKPATNMTALNLESNGFQVEFFDEFLENCMVASGKNFEVYHMDIRHLSESLDEKFDLCIIDTFPGVENTDFIKAAQKIAKDILVI